MAEPPTFLQNIARIRGDLSLASTLSFPAVVVDAENRLGIVAKHAHLPLPERAAACVFDLRRARSMFEDCGYAVARLSFADMCATAMSDFAAPDLARCLESYYGTSPAQSGRKRRRDNEPAAYADDNDDDDDDDDADDDDRHSSRSHGGVQSRSRGGGGIVGGSGGGGGTGGGTGGSGGEVCDDGSDDGAHQRPPASVDDDDDDGDADNDETSRTDASARQSAAPVSDAQLDDWLHGRVVPPAEIPQSDDAPEVPDDWRRFADTERRSKKVERAAWHEKFDIGYKPDCWGHYPAGHAFAGKPKVSDNGHKDLFIRCLVPGCSNGTSPGWKPGGRGGAGMSIGNFLKHFESDAHANNVRAWLRRQRA